MKHFSLPALAALSLALSACGTQTKVPPIAPPPVAQSSSSGNGQLEFALASGTYGCEHGVRLKVERDVRDHVNYRVRVAWNGTSYRLERDPSYSGLPRFEDAASGLVWIDLPWKSLLLDGKTNKPLANECRSV